MNNRPKMRWAHGQITRGVWKGKMFEIDFGDGTPASTSVKVDGKDVSKHILAVHFHLRADEAYPRISMEVVDFD